LPENAARDYQRIDALDTYGPEGLDDEGDYDVISREQRLAAEQQLNALAGRRSQVYDQLIVGDDEDDEDADARQARRGMFRTSRAKESADDDEMAPGVEESESSYVELDWDDPTWNPFQCLCAYGSPKTGHDVQKFNGAFAKIFQALR
jgi:Mini-chromosome maintenance protein 2